MVLYRLPWPLACALLATMQAASAAIQASNSSAAETFDYAGQIMLNSSAQVFKLEPLSMDATQRNVEGNLYLTTDATYNGISADDIAFMSCDDQDYAAAAKANDTFQNTYEKTGINGVILYSTRATYCTYENITPVLQNFPIYSMDNTTASQTLLDLLQDKPASEPFAVQIKSDAPAINSDEGDQNSTNANVSSQSPLGPSPSTAVAMIILYSITGIITALFLVIITTGAIRAHRHPERYGTHDHMGRPRQSRARGLGRAILDTLPIVKFGQPEPSKPADVELGSTAESGAATAEPNAQAEAAGTETRQAPPADAPPADQHAAMESGISAAQAGTSTTQPDASSDAGLGCSICTDDFEHGQDIRVLPCNHKFHPDCVDPWLLNVSGTCPLCRVDLRPVPTNDSADDDEDDGRWAYSGFPYYADFPPDPAERAARAARRHRRRSAMRDILSFRARPDASPAERISALRRLREQRRDRSVEGLGAGTGASASAGVGVGGGSRNASTEDVAAHNRRSNRLSARWSGVFGGRGRRAAREDEGLDAVAGGSAAAPSSSEAEEQRAVSPAAASSSLRPGSSSERR